MLSFVLAVALHRWREQAGFRIDDAHILRIASISQDMNLPETVSGHRPGDVVRRAGIPSGPLENATASNCANSLCGDVPPSRP